MRTGLLCCIAGNMPGKIQNDFKMTASIVEFHSKLTFEISTLQNKDKSYLVTDLF